MNVDRRYFIAHGHGHVGDQPPPGLPEARRSPGAVVRPLSPHRQRHLPHRQAAALPRRAEEPAQDGTLDLRRPEADRRPEAQRRDRQGRRRHRDSGRAQVVPRPPLRPAGRPPLPQRDPAQRLPELRDRPGPTSLHDRPEQRSRPRCTASSTRTSARRRRSTASSAASRRPPKKTTKQHKLPKSQISVLVLNAGRVAGQAENTSVPARDARLHDEDAARGRPGQRAEGAAATRPSTTTRCRRTRSRPRSSFGRSSARTRASKQMTPPDLRLRGAGRQPADGRHGRDELPRHAHDPQATEGAAEDAAAGERRRRA